MSDDPPIRGSIVGLGGLASLCCLGPGTAAVTGGVAAGGAGAGLLETAAVGVALAAAVFVIRRRSCGECDRV